MMAVVFSRRRFADLFAKHANMVHGILLSRVPRGEVEDLMQDVFVSALQSFDSLRGEFGPWIATIARNRAIDFYRTRKKTTELPEDLPHDQAAHSDRSQAERILALIRELPEAYRETLVLRLVEGMTGPEIAERVGLTPESVRVNLHRGIAMLREKLS
jgi:RNA polymerase sigma-70 factor, ECF subfamily